MKIAVLAPVAWRTPPRHYGPWEQIAWSTAEGLIDQGHDVTLFATGDSQTRAKLESVCAQGWEEDSSVDPKVAECLHIGHLMAQAAQFDLIHNHFDFHPLIFASVIATPIVTTIHGFSSPKILAVYEKYNKNSHYISISNSDRNSRLEYLATVYNGIETEQFNFCPTPGEYLLFFGRIHPDKGTAEAIEISKRSGRPLLIAGIIQDQKYFAEKIEPHLDNRQVTYLGPVGYDRRSELLGQAYALLHPINFAEPFGLSVVEAMCCGTPVIAFKRGAMSELIVHGKTGYLVQDVSEALDVLNQVKQLDRKDCREQVLKKFSRKQMVDGYLQAYQKILS
ncbi:MAG: glycosyltransferase family 4 protein [bacterium]